MGPNTTNRQPVREQKLGSLQDFQAGCVEVYPNSSDSYDGEPVIAAAVRLAPDSDYFRHVTPWISERGAVPDAPIPEMPAEDLEAVVRVLTQRGFKHLVIESTGAQRLETLIANSLTKHLDSRREELSITRLMCGNAVVAFTTWSKQKAGEAPRFHASTR